MAKNIKQKDWIIADYNRGHLWCLAIRSEDGGKNWYFIEWVNLVSVSGDKLHKAMMTGYKTMIEAKGEVDDYEFIQGEHKFNPNKLKTGYWEGLILPYGKMEGKVSIEYGKDKVDKSQFDKETTYILNKKVKKSALREAWDLLAKIDKLKETNNG